MVENPEHTLWHAGGPANTNSVGLVVLGNYEHDIPPERQISALASAITGKYPDISPDMIKGHREVNPLRSCPGDKFLGDSGWKKTLCDSVK